MNKKSLLASVLTLTLAFGLALLPSMVLAGDDCKAPIIGDLIQKFRDECKKEGVNEPNQCADDASTLAKIITRLNSIFNNGRFTIGARFFEFGKNQDGKIIAPGDRTFVSNAPLDKDNVNIAITKLDGQALVEVSVCKIDVNGTATRLDTFTIDPDFQSNNSVAKSYSGLKGNYLQVYLNGKHAGRVFKMTIRADKS